MPLRLHIAGDAGDRAAPRKGHEVPADIVVDGGASRDCEEDEPGRLRRLEAANAIMDVRVFNMKRTIRRQLERKATLSSDERLRFEALESAGCLSSYLPP